MNDFMKYWRIIRYYYTQKYQINERDLDLLLYLYSEKYFTKNDCYLFLQTLPWDKSRFTKLRKKGFLDIHSHAHKNRSTIWKMTFKGKKLVASLYAKLNGGTISENYQFNRMFLDGAGYAHKVYRNVIKKMNEEIRTGKFSDD